MPLMRNPFRSRPNDQIYDENIRPVGSDGRDALPSETWGSKPISIKTNSSTQEDSQPREYKLSEIDRSGTYLPPSPTETKSSFWSSRSGASTRTSSHRSVLNECEPFSISRESFDSYRRSFDISARSPVIDASPGRPRQSLDARQLRLPSAASSNSPPSKGSKSSRPVVASARRPSATPFQPRPNILPDNHVNPPSAEPDEPESVVPQAAAGTEEPSKKATTPAEAMVDRFEDVGLGDPADPSPAFKKQLPSAQQPKKTSIFARFGGSSTPEHNISATDNAAAGRPGSSGLGIGLGMFGRKRGASGQGAELGNIEQSRQGHAHAHGTRGKRDSVSSATPTEVKVDS